jgi:hypothetical protein
LTRRQASAAISSIRDAWVLGFAVSPFSAEKLETRDGRRTAADLMKLALGAQSGRWAGDNISPPNHPRDPYAAVAEHLTAMAAVPAVNGIEPMPRRLVGIEPMPRRLVGKSPVLGMGYQKGTVLMHPRQSGKSAALADALSVVGKIEKSPQRVFVDPVADLLSETEEAQ